MEDHHKDGEDEHANRREDEDVAKRPLDRG